MIEKNLNDNQLLNQFDQGALDFIFHSTRMLKIFELCTKKSKHLSSTHNIDYCLLNTVYKQYSLEANKIGDSKKYKVGNLISK